MICVQPLYAVTVSKTHHTYLTNFHFIVVNSAAMVVVLIIIHQNNKITYSTINNANN